MPALVFPAAPTIGQIYTPGDGAPSYVYRGDSVWQNVGMGYGYGPVAFTATPGQTTITVAYQVGAVDVFIEGARLDANDFTATNGTSIVLTDPLLGGENGVVIPHSILSTLEGLNKNLNLSDLLSADTALTNLGFSTLGKTLRAVADAAAGRAAIVAPPLPQTASGVGQWAGINSTSGGAATLPAGGTWAWARFPKDVATSQWGGGITVGVDAGGTIVGAATAGIQWHVLAWRIS